MCINLKKRIDRKNKMIDLFRKENVINYEFFEAIDGNLVNLTHPDISYFKHDERYAHCKGNVGCSLSHITLWKKLLQDSDNNMYLIVEDDIRLTSNFQIHLDKIISQTTDIMDFILLGMTIGIDDYHRSREMYACNNSFTIHPLTHRMYAGGFFGYIINKTCAKKFIDYIDLVGVKGAIDFTVSECPGIDIFETRPHLIFTDSVQYGCYNVDSDIQHNYNKIIMFPNAIINNYDFDDYIFHPNQDSPGNDIQYSYVDILSLKNIADNLEECQGFNTYGWIKHSICDDRYLIDLPDRYHYRDGMYVKKNYDKMAVIKRKFGILNKKIKNGPIKIYVTSDANKYSKFIIDMIIASYPLTQVVADTRICDIYIGHIDDEHLPHPDVLSILISGEPWNTKKITDIAICTKYESNAKMTIYYPFIFSSLREHNKSINPLNYKNTRTKFCAYMYNMIHQHRINYFNLVSTYKRVDGLSRCCNNVDIELTRYVFTEKETYNDIAVQYYTEYKFVLAIENRFVPGYSTEKLMNPLIAGSVPIYWGNSDIFKYINKKRVVYVQDFASDQELLDYIIYLDTNDEAYQSIINENIFVDPNFSLDNIEVELAEKIKSELDLNRSFI